MATPDDKMQAAVQKLLEAFTDLVKAAAKWVENKNNPPKQ